MKYKALLKVFL